MNSTYICPTVGLPFDREIDFAADEEIARACERERSALLRRERRASRQRRRYRRRVRGDALAVSVHAFLPGDCRVGKGARHTHFPRGQNRARRAHAATLRQRSCPPYGASDGFEGEARSLAHDGAEA